jgi:excisionase family DNA binding protein
MQKHDVLEEEHRSDWVPGGDESVSAPLLTPAEAARYLGVGKKVIYRLIEWGELRNVKAKGAVWIEKSSLDAFRSKGRLT